MKKPSEVRLPTEKQWAQAAGGDEDKKRYPWDKGAATDKTEEVVQRANISESGLNRTTPVWMYPLGASTSGVMELAGNVWEWQANYYSGSHSNLGLRGGSWIDSADGARVAFRVNYRPLNWYISIGFRVVASFLPSG